MSEEPGLSEHRWNRRRLVIGLAPLPALLAAACGTGGQQSTPTGPAGKAVELRSHARADSDMDGL